MKKTIIATLLSLTTLFCSNQAEGQIFKQIFKGSGESKKELKKEISTLQRTIDSLRQELELSAIPIIDTVTVNTNCFHRQFAECVVPAKLINFGRWICDRPGQRDPHL